MNQIFLSYRNLESEFALKLAADLKNAGVRVWVDRLDGIVVGADWRHAIEQAINTCAAMISVLSPGYVESAYCRNELARADTLKRPIFPILLEAVSSDRWPLEVQRAQYENFTGWRDEITYRLRLDSLLQRLRVEAGDQIGPLPDAETRYLTSLIAAMEAKRGVIQYVELASEAEAANEYRPAQSLDDEWGYGWLQARIGAAPSAGADVPSAAPTKVRLAGMAEALERFPRFVLLGMPGAGKTTTLRRLIRDAAWQRLKNPLTAPLPLLIDLSTWKHEATPADLVRSRWALASDSTAALRTGDLWLFLDGLNEMGERANHHVGQLRNWFDSPDGPARVVVACRTGVYASPDIRLGNLPTVEIKELEEAQIQGFAANYLGSKAPTFLNRVLPGSEAANGGRGLLPLVSNPYLLSALIIVFERNGGEGDLPRNTGMLFRGLARALWEREAKRGTSGWVPYDQAERAFATLAYSMIDENLGTAVRQDSAERRLQSADLLLAGISANYLVRDGDDVRFYHQLLQEFFAAVGLLRSGLKPWAAPSYQFIPGGVRNTNPLTWRSRGSSKWDEAIVALCGIVDNPSEMISQVLATDPALATQCVASGVLLDSETRRKTIDHLVSLLKSDWQIVAAVSQALQHLNDRAAVPGLVAILRGQPDYGEFGREAAALVLGGLGGAEAVAGLRQALNCESPAVRARAAESLGRIGDPVAVPDLAYHLGDTDWTTHGGLHYGTSAQKNAATALQRIAERSAEAVVPAVLDALRSPYAPTRAAAALVLGAIGDQRAVPGLIDALTYDLDGFVRNRAAEALGKLQDERAISALFVALGNFSEQPIAEALAQFGRAVLPRLIEALRSPSWKTRSGAIDALRMMGDPEAIPALEQVVKNAEDRNLLIRATEAIDRIRKQAK